MLHRYYGSKSGRFINGAFFSGNWGMHPCGDDAAKDLHQRIIEVENLLKRLIYQPLHLHTAQFQVFMPACKRWGTIRGGVWVSGGAPKGADVLQFPPQSYPGLLAKQSFHQRLSGRWFRGSPLCAVSWLSTQLLGHKMGKMRLLPNSALLVSTRPNPSPHPPNHPPIHDIATMIETHTDKAGNLDAG